MLFADFIKKNRVTVLGISVAAKPQRMPSVLISYLNRYFRDTNIFNEDMENEYMSLYEDINDKISVSEDTLFVFDNYQLFLEGIKISALDQSLDNGNTHIIIATLGVTDNEIQMFQKMNAVFVWFNPTDFDIQIDNIMIDSVPSDEQMEKYKREIEEAKNEDDKLKRIEILNNASNMIGLKYKSNKLRNLALQIILKPLKRHYIRVSGNPEPLYNLMLDNRVSNIEDIILMRLSDSDEEKREAVSNANEARKLVFITDYAPPSDLVPNNIGAMHIVDGGYPDDIETVKDLLKASKYGGSYPRHFELFHHISVMENYESMDIKRYQTFNDNLKEMSEIYEKMKEKRRVFIKDQDLYTT